MTDPFSRKHANDNKAAEKAAREAYKKTITEQNKARVKFNENLKALNPNRDVGTPWRKKFWEPGY